MLLEHCTYADLATMSVDDVEVATRFLDAYLEAKNPPKRPKR